MQAPKQFNLLFGEFKQKDKKKLHGRLQPE
jgi:hypothetical protein